MKGWYIVASALLVTLTISCNGKIAPPTAPEGSSGGDASPFGGAHGGGAAGSTVQLGAGGDSSQGGTGACPACPGQAGLTPCCDQFCGYRNDRLDECVSSVVGGRTLLVVESPNGELCTVRPQCEQSPGCPATIPPDGSACTSAMTCHYCMGMSLARAVTCVGGTWTTVGPNKHCNAYTDPAH
jgi:hypothetical protein